MAGNTGTLGLSDLLAQTYVSAEQFGVQTIQEVAQADVEAYNGIWRPLMADFVAVTTDAQRVSGGSSTPRSQKVNQAGRAATQIVGKGGTVGFPVDKFQYNLGWTADYYELATPADMAQQTLGAQAAHALDLTTEFKRAIYRSANYSYVDEYSKGITLTVRRFANGDGMPIASGPNGETFDGTSHSHYLYASSMTAGLLTSLIATVQEHNANARVQLCLNSADALTVQALSGFDPLIYANFTVNANASVPLARRDIGPVNNVQIGTFNKVAEVWIKPWAVANYVVALDVNAPEKPVVLREPIAGRADLRIRAQFNAFPLSAEYMEWMFGMGVWGRVRGAVAYTGSSSAYADPTL